MFQRPQIGTRALRGYMAPCSGRHRLVLEPGPVPEGARQAAYRFVRVEGYAPEFERDGPEVIGCHEQAQARSGDGIAGHLTPRQAVGADLRDAAGVARVEPILHRMTDPGASALVDRRPLYLYDPRRSRDEWFALQLRGAGDVAPQPAGASAQELEVWLRHLVGTPGGTVAPTSGPMSTASGPTALVWRDGTPSGIEVRQASGDGWKGPAVEWSQVGELRIPTLIEVRTAPPAASAGVLSLDGRFPLGGVELRITDSTGRERTLPAKTWSPSGVSADLEPQAAGRYEVALVSSAGRARSNALTFERRGDCIS